MDASSIHNFNSPVNPPDPAVAHRRLQRLELAAHRIVPTVTAWAILHNELRRLELAYNSPDLAALFDRVDQALGGRRER